MSRESFSSYIIGIGIGISSSVLVFRALTVRLAHEIVVVEGV